MTTLTAELGTQITEAIHANRAALAASFNSALGTNYEIARGQTHAGIDKALVTVPGTPGLAVTFKVGDQGLVVIIPESMPLPGWYRAPNDSQSSRLQTLPMEWSLSLFPPEVEAEEYVSVACGDLRKQLEASLPEEDVTILDLELLAPLATTQKTRMWAIWPVAVPQFQPVVTFEDLKRSRVGGADQHRNKAPASEAELRRRRLLRVPVQLVVRIAEKKIDVHQVRGFSPGTLLTFNKPCEALLDVYVGEHLYCRGEAVKVGENFGIKINEMNAGQVRERKVHRI